MSLKTLSNLSLKDTPSKWSSQISTQVGIFPKPELFPPLGESSGHIVATGRVFNRRSASLLPPNNLGEVCMESSLFLCGHWLYHQGKTYQECNLFTELLKGTAIWILIHFRWEPLYLDLQMQRALKKVVRDGGGQDLLSLSLTLLSTFTAALPAQGTGFNIKPVHSYFTGSHQPLSLFFCILTGTVHLTETVRVITTNPKSAPPVTDWWLFGALIFSVKKGRSPFAAVVGGPFAQEPQRLECWRRRCLFALSTTQLTVMVKGSCSLEIQFTLGVQLGALPEHGLLKKLDLVLLANIKLYQVLISSPSGHYKLSSQPWPTLAHNLLCCLSLASWKRSRASPQMSHEDCPWSRGSWRAPSQ